MNRSDFRVIVTVSPVFLGSSAFGGILRRKDIIYRINGSHTSAASLEKMVRRIRGGYRNAEILLDLPGNKIRVRCLKPIKLRRGAYFKLGKDDVSDGVFFRNIKEGDMLFAQDSTLSFEVVEKRGDSAVFISKIDGLLRNNKGLHRKGITNGIVFVSDRDRALIEDARRAGISSLGVSYARSAEDLRSLKNSLPPFFKPRLYIKIETAMAVKNLGQIIREGECFIVDRGDLASEIGLSSIPAVQSEIIGKLAESGKKIFLATQFLRNMIKHPVPLIAEVNDIANVLGSGVNGIQLSDETAIGRFPLSCVEMIIEMKKIYHKSFKEG